MDIVDDVMQLLRVRHRASYRICRGGDWARRIDADALFHFHCLLQGRCFFRQATETGWRAMHAGDVLVLPRGAATRLKGTCCGPAQPTEVRLPLGFVADGRQHGGQRLLLLGAEVELAGETLHPLITGLPDATLIPHAAFARTGTRRHAGYLVDQMLPHGPAAQAAVLDRLVEILLIQVIWAYQAVAGQTFRFMEALQDPCLRRTIVAIHRHPGHNWSLDRLARVAQLSRSVFSRRFTDRVGIAAMHYLTLWRMQTAIHQLRAGQTCTETIARSLGYRSTEAFSKAFKRVHGVTPVQAVTRAARHVAPLPRAILETASDPVPFGRRQQRSSVTKL